MKGLEEALQAELAALAAADRLRRLPPLSGASRVYLEPAPGERLVSFASNDYLGLAGHPEVLAAAADSAAREGFGASAARLVTGDFPSHRALEQALVTFLGRPAALLFPTGYQTNLGVIGALAGRDDLIISDALNHASLIDGCRLSRARVAVYPHGDVAAARRLLTEQTGFRRRLLVTESVFSMDGDTAPLDDLAEVARVADALLIVDEAHALGVVGPAGRGLCAQSGVAPDVLVGTLGKALGAAGGFAVGSIALRDLLLNRARTFVFTTALPPPVAAAALAALRLTEGPDGDRRRAVLDRHRATLGDALATRGLASARPPGAIVPVVLGSNARALAASAGLRARGLYVPAIRPPTVPEGSARLRVTLSAAHTSDQLAALVRALAEVVA